eukprot:CAMPEP_0196591242 /NCGR_PEP_ID=MMETSP1081-20130531/68928_1 /TAXON_ID=36882 /ORGANISM="Pyramimonas amylifera, Strain CCMP720" /LENGTH=527 /DNA_ID=CAMNT_0041914545 /DNA_START=196 /DNA_END=1779 /DNA_ORIENTATION=+
MPLQGDYTFTDRELHDVLGFLELMNQPSSKQQESPELGFGILDEIGEFVSRPNIVPPPSAGLQFQPHISGIDPLLQLNGYAPADSGGLTNVPMSHPLYSSSLAERRSQAHQALQLHQTHQALQAHQVHQTLHLQNHQYPSHSSNVGGARGGLADMMTKSPEFLSMKKQTLYPDTKPDIRSTGASSSSQHWSNPVQQYSALKPDHEGGMTFGEDNAAKVSHGASEKQRRDRINNMIEQLRLLVPAGGGMRAMHPASFNPESASETKRSKYVVLVETIQLITLQNHQLKEREKEIEMLRQYKLEHEASCSIGGAGTSADPYATTFEGGKQKRPSTSELMKQILSQNDDMFEEELEAGSHSAAHSPRTMSCEEGGDGEQDSHPRPSSPERSETAQVQRSSGSGLGIQKSGGSGLAVQRSSGSGPGIQRSGGSGLASHPDVSIDMGLGHCYIKVTCVDRRGLLADILAALSSLPLEVKRAAITTSVSGAVTDIFEVKLDSGININAEDLKVRVVENLLSEDSALGSKRKAH